MMIRLVFLYVMVLPIFGFSQEQVAQPQFFVQAELNAILTDDVMSDLKTDLAQNPQVFMVRVDILNHTIYLITNEMDDFNESIFQGWIANQENVYSCYYQGILSVDSFKPFDNQFCED
jgi:hypothetical protein